MGSNSELTVAYWAIRGLGAPLRMICEYKGANYKAVNYEAKMVEGKLNKDCWFKDPNAKQAILKRNPLANLPYLIDGDLVICQTNAIFKYLGRKFDLYGNNDIEMSKTEQCLYQIYDLRNDMVRVFYDPTGKFEQLADALLNKKAPTHLKKMENWLAMYKTVYCISDTPCVADFHLWELIDQLEMFAKDRKHDSLLKGYPNLQQLYTKFRNLDALANYFKSDSYKLPCNNVHAKWK